MSKPRDLARVVPQLQPEALHQLIRHRGLDASGELLAAATPAQLTTLLDLDLWRHAAPGRDDRFDVDRFGEWIEVLVDAGSSVAARTVAALDQDVVVAGLSRYVRVFDPGIFEPIAQSDDEPTDRHQSMREGDSIHARDGSGRDAHAEWLECELGGYIVRARRADGWDAMVALLAALESEDSAGFHALMRGCRHLSNSRPETDGLDDLLATPEQHLHEVAIDRERRRSEQGYATPADARAFLQMARQPRSERSKAEAGAPSINPIFAAYFRATDQPPESSASPLQPPCSTSSQADLLESSDAVIELLAEAGSTPQRPRGLLETPDADPQVVRLARLRQLMEHARDTDHEAFFARTRELAFLANGLLAGCSVQSRAFTPQEASDAAASICNLGLECWPGGHDLVAAFEVGWSVLHRDVSLFTAARLVSTIDDLHSVDRDIRSGLLTLRRALLKQLDAGTPWRAREAAEILAMLDMTCWISVLGLLDECPIVPAALRAALGGRTTSVSQTAFEFISTPAQIDDVRAFLRRLPELLL